ncbi:transposase [Micromonospora sp. KC207]|uniref:transposase n=1 Tax=Micromonospora sp. KC207 TaxID=2530377 RepID=UPI00352FBE81
MSVHAVTDVASCPLDWRLFLPTSWDDRAVDEADGAGVAARRARCGIPGQERHRPKWALVVDLLDKLAEDGLRPPLLAADAGYGDDSQFRSALDQRGIGYIMRVKGDALPIRLSADTPGRAPRRPRPGRASGRRWW